MGQQRNDKYPLSIESSVMVCYNDSRDNGPHEPEGESARLHIDFVKLVDEPLSKNSVDCTIGAPIWILERAGLLFF